MYWFFLESWASLIWAGSKRKRDPQEDEEEKGEGGPLYRYKPWLGFWDPAFNKITNITELVLQVLLGEYMTYRCLPIEAFLISRCKSCCTCRALLLLAGHILLRKGLKGASWDARPWSMQAKYDISNSKNEDIVSRLLELYKFECAIMREHDNDHGIETESGINHKASILISHFFPEHFFRKAQV